jgi:hypothetical protein
MQLIVITVHNEMRVLDVWVRVFIAVHNEMDVLDV